MSKNRYEFKINGNDYVLVTDRDKEETDRIVTYVDSKIADAKKSLSYRNTTMHATLAALNIANDLYDIESRFNNLKETCKEPLEKYEPLKEEFERFVNENRESIEKIKNLNSRNKELESLLSAMKVERDKFKLELDRQIKLSEKSIEDNNILRERLLEQEKMTLEAKKQLQEFTK